ncbi:MAG: 50S ribosomal protein L30 [Bacteroidetes bacterium]|nr:MAG: 50S ribosomal protein L30 [Bacteroidota bacterium]
MSKIRVTQVRSLIGATKSQRATMATLGLRRIRHSVELEDREDLKGALRKVEHLVVIEKL